MLHICGENLENAHDALSDTAALRKIAEYGATSQGKNCLKISKKYLAHVIEQPNFRIPNPQYLQQNFCFDFFNDSENTF